MERKLGDEQTDALSEPEPRPPWRPICHREGPAHEVYNVVGSLDVEPHGWLLCAMNDPSGRRGIWMRRHYNEAKELVRLDLCAGREGDDDFCSIAVGEPVSAKALRELEGAMLTGAWMIDEAGIAERRQSGK